MFTVGDKIVYPMHGAGIIEKVEEKKILGETRKYYILRVPPEFNSSILIKHEKKSRKPREIAVFYLQSPRVNGIIY